jgi:hypothetical protein
MKFRVIMLLLFAAYGAFLASALTATDESLSGRLALVGVATVVYALAVGIFTTDKEDR